MEPAFSVLSCFLVMRWEALLCNILLPHWAVWPQAQHNEANWSWTGSLETVSPDNLFLFRSWLLQILWYCDGKLINTVYTQEGNQITKQGSRQIKVIHSLLAPSPPWPEDLAQAPSLGSPVTFHTPMLGSGWAPGKWTTSKPQPSGNSITKLWKERSGDSVYTHSKCGQGVQPCWCC